MFTDVTWRSRNKFDDLNKVIGEIAIKFFGYFFPFLFRFSRKSNEQVRHHHVPPVPEHMVHEEINAIGKNIQHSQRQERKQPQGSVDYVIHAN